jgi:hypothetical protein
MINTEIMCSSSTPITLKKELYNSYAANLPLQFIRRKIMAKTTGKGNTAASKIYTSVAKKHPEWTQARVYAVTRAILAKRNVAKAENKAFA